MEEREKEKENHYIYIYAAASCGRVRGSIMCRIL